MPRPKSMIVTPNPAELTVGHFLKKHLASAEILAAQGEAPVWTRQDFCQKFDAGAHGSVVTWECLVVGFLVYEAAANEVCLLNFLIDHAFRRCGFGRRLMESFLASPRIKGRRVYASIPERHLENQLFLKALGFQCKRIINKRNNSCCYIMERVA